MYELGYHLGSIGITFSMLGFFNPFIFGGLMPIGFGLKTLSDILYNMSERSK